MKSLFDRFKKGSNKSLTSIDAALMEIKFSSIVDGSIDDIWCYLFFLNHVGYLSLDEVSHLIDPLKNAESDLYADSEGLDEMIEELEYIEPVNRGVNEFLISLMYKNKNDKENALKYEKLSKEHLKQFDELNKK